MVESSPTENLKVFLEKTALFQGHQNSMDWSKIWIFIDAILRLCVHGDHRENPYSLYSFFIKNGVFTWFCLLKLF